MFDIMFMRHKWNETARLIWSAPHLSHLSRGGTLEQMRLLADETITRALNSAVRSSVKHLNSAMNTNDYVI